MYNDTLYTQCLDAVPSVLRLTEPLVNMDSGSTDFPQLRCKAEFLQQLFQGIGAQSELWEAPAPRQGSWNVVSTFTGSGTVRILILTHYDTVFPAGEAQRRPFSCDGVNAHGPGVADMQASIAMLGIGIPLLHNILPPHAYKKLTIFCNADEEIGSFGARDHIIQLAKEHDITLNMELSGADGTCITVSARGMGNATLTVTGKAAHAASEPPQGANAGLELAHQILLSRDLSDMQKRTAVNCTIAGFGVKANIIPDHAQATVNIRVADPAEFDRVETALRHNAADTNVPGCSVHVDMTIATMPYANNPATLALASRVQQIAQEEMGITLTHRHAFGSNDTNFSAQYCPSLDGFGPGCTGMHTVDETLPVKTIAPRLYLLLRTLQELCAGNIPLGDK